VIQDIFIAISGHFYLDPRHESRLGPTTRAGFLRSRTRAAFRLEPEWTWNSLKELKGPRLPSRLGDIRQSGRGDRGTSTYDGLSIAQACMEFLHDVVGCRTLFATPDASPGRYEEMFAYRVVPGRAGQSHGLKVAMRANLPSSVLARAAVLLAQHTHSTGAGS
jgi:hypothetical protein